MQSKILLFLITLLIFSCATTSVNISEKVKKPTEIKVYVSYANDIKIGDKFLYKQPGLTEDGKKISKKDKNKEESDKESDVKTEEPEKTEVKKEEKEEKDTIAYVEEGAKPVDEVLNLSEGDSTTDSTKKDEKQKAVDKLENLSKVSQAIKKNGKIDYHYIKDPGKITHLKTLEGNFFDSIVFNFNKKVKGVNFSKSDMPLDEEIGFVINIIISEYREGEFNLIKNEPTVFKLKAFVNSSKKNIAFFEKKYIFTPDIERPFEKLRIEKGCDQFSTEFLKFVKSKIFIQEKELPAKKETDEKSGDKKLDESDNKDDKGEKK